MTSINYSILVGKLTKAPEFSETAAKKRFARLSLETEEYLKIHGETKRVAQVHTVVCFNQFSLPFLEQFAKAGTRLKVSGKLSYDRNGKAEIIVSQYSGEVGPMDIETPKSSETPAVPAATATTAKPGGGYGKMSLPKTPHNAPHDDAQYESSRKTQEDLEDDAIPF